MKKEKKNRYGAPPKVEAPKILNFSKEASNKTITFSFTVPTEFKREYRLYASRKDLKLVEVFIKSFEEYIKNNP